MPDPEPIPSEGLTPAAGAATPTFEDTVRRQLIDELKRTTDKLEQDRVSIGDLKILTRSLKELRYAFKVFSAYRHRRKVSVFGSARTPPDDPDFLASVEFGKLMAMREWMVVTGAGNGIMEGAHIGAGPKLSMGVNIMLPFEQSANEVIAKDEKLVTLRYFFTRKLMFVKEVHAAAFFPGGFGTQDELFELLTLVQTGKRDLLPMVCVASAESDYWHDWDRYVQRHLLGRKLISPEDLSLVYLSKTPMDAVEEIFRFYTVYHSSRYIRDKLIIRLNRELSDELLDRLNAEFAAILEGGQIERVATHPYEQDDQHTRHLPRLSLRFNRRDTGRLRMMVDLINREAA
jgi:uncharacterized protein (TIGR00730 family)